MPKVFHRVTRGLSLLRAATYFKRVAIRAAHGPSEAKGKHTARQPPAVVWAPAYASAGYPASLLDAQPCAAEPRAASALDGPSAAVGGAATPATGRRRRGNARDSTGVAAG